MWLPDQGGPQGSGTCKEETEFFSKGTREPWEALELGRAGHLGHPLRLKHRKEWG